MRFYALFFPDSKDCCLIKEQVSAFIHQLFIEEEPGLGWVQCQEYHRG